MIVRRRFHSHRETGAYFQGHGKKDKKGVDERHARWLLADAPTDEQDWQLMNAGHNHLTSASR